MLFLMMSEISTPAFLPVFYLTKGSFFSSSSIIFDVDCLDINFDDCELDVTPSFGLIEPLRLALSKSFIH
jgi:hypothetical protein